MVYRHEQRSGGDGDRRGWVRENRAHESGRIWFTGSAAAKAVVRRQSVFVQRNRCQRRGADDESSSGRRRTGNCAATESMPVSARGWCFSVPIERAGHGKRVARAAFSVLSLPGINSDGQCLDVSARIKDLCFKGMKQHDHSADLVDKKTGGSVLPPVASKTCCALLWSANTFRTPESFGMLFHGSPNQSP